MKKVSRRQEARPPLTVSLADLIAGGSDNAFRTLVHGLLAFGARLEAVRSGFGALIGLSGIQYTILISIRHLEIDSDVSVTRIARHLHLSGAFVTVETGKLIKLGLLTKQTDPKDRRRVCLRVTRKGFDLLDSLAPTQRRVNDVLFEPVDSEQFPALRSLVDRMVKSGDRAVALLDYLTRH
jgi:DNA-binding MarR family transcriptional regulator